MPAGRFALSECDALLRLVHAAALAPRGWSALLAAHGSAAATLALSDRALKAGGIDARCLPRLRREAVPSGWLAWLEGAGRRLVGVSDSDFPPRLAALPDAPLALWLEGVETARLAAPQLAIVGSRRATRNGLDTAASFARYLSDAGLVVTSGLARGIDAASHAAALDGAGGTIAVLGCGIDSVYPRAHAALAARVAERGVLVSEYPPGVPPRALHFPQRNRIIAGLTLGTLVVEATRRSGSLITARLANDFGREVFAVPGSIHNPLARGCHALLRQGAILVEEPQEILAALAPIAGLDVIAPQPGEGTAAAERSPREPLAAVWDQLGFEPRSFDILAAELRLTAGELSSMLLHLELEGFVEALPGGRFCRRAKRDR